MMNWFLQNWVVDPKWKPTNLYTWEPFCPNHPAKMNCHTALLRSDGNAVACGENSFGQCAIPPLDGGISYTQVSALVSYLLGIFLFLKGFISSVRGDPVLRGTKGSEYSTKRPAGFLRKFGLGVFSRPSRRMLQCRKVGKRRVRHRRRRIHRVRGGPEPLQFYGKLLHVS